MANLMEHQNLLDVSGIYLCRSVSTKLMLYSIQKKTDMGIKGSEEGPRRTAESQYPRGHFCILRVVGEMVHTEC
jgi:hypothetical protein